MLKIYFENIERILNLMDFRLFQSKFTLISDWKVKFSAMLWLHWILQRNPPQKQYSPILFKLNYRKVLASNHIYTINLIIFLNKTLVQAIKHMMHKINTVLLCRHLRCHNLSRRFLSWTLPGGPPSYVCRCRGFVGRFSLSNGSILWVWRRMKSFVCFYCVLCLFSPYSAYGCLQTKNHQNSWKWLELSVGNMP